MSQWERRIHGVRTQQNADIKPYIFYIMIDPNYVDDAGEYDISDEIRKMGTEITTIKNNEKRRESISSFGVVVHDVQRLGTILNVLRKFGFGNIVKAVRSGLTGDFRTSNEIVETFKSQSDDTAAKLRQMIEELGTTYIKFGQMLSTRYDLLPPNIIRELSKLQDSSPQMPFDVIEDILNQTYGDYHEYFESVDRTVLGSASIAQAHRAILKDKTHVVIKVQRPNLLPLIRSDIDIINLIAKTLDNHIEEIAYFNLPALIDEFERSIVTELDFNHERENIEYFMAHYGSNEMFVFPEPIVSLSRSNILVMKEIEGKKITQIEPDTPEAHKMADAILDMAFEMVVRDGVFHADPHPGNVFATPDNRIGLLDFGLVGNFTVQQRQEFMRMILAIKLGDCGMIARSLMTLGHPTRRVVLSELEAEISNILHKHMKSSLQSIDAAAFANEFVSAGQRFAVQIPSEFTNAVRALINIEGIIVYLKPDLDVIRTLGRFSEKLLANNLKKENINTILFQLGLEGSELVRSVPSHFAQLMQDIEHDGVAVRLNRDAINPVVDALNIQATRLSVSLMLLGITFCLLLSSHPYLFDFALVLCVIWTLFLLIWHFKRRTTRNRMRINPILERIRRRGKWY